MPILGQSEDPEAYATAADTVGRTPLVRLTRVTAGGALPAGTVLLAKLEGNNPAGSVKDRPALGMIAGAEARGEIAPGDRLIEATSGNTGIALAAIAAMKGYKSVEGGQGFEDTERGRSPPDDNFCNN
jgi:cysteine synthase B